MHERLSVSNVLATVAVGYAAATVAAVIVILLWTLDFEAVSIGFFAPLFVAPAIVGFALTSRGRRLRRIVYAALVIPMPLYSLSVVLFPSPGAISDAADQWALAFLIPMIAAGIAGYAALEWWLPERD